MRNIFLCVLFAVAAAFVCGCHTKQGFSVSDKAGPEWAVAKYVVVAMQGKGVRIRDLSMVAGSKPSFQLSPNGKLAITFGNDPSGRAMAMAVCDRILIPAIALIEKQGRSVRSFECGETKVVIGYASGHLAVRAPVDSAGVAVLEKQREALSDILSSNRKIGLHTVGFNYYGISDAGKASIDLLRGIVSSSTTLPPASLSWSDDQSIAENALQDAQAAHKEIKQVRMLSDAAFEMAKASHAAYEKANGDSKEEEKSKRFDENKRAIQTIKDNLSLAQALNGRVDMASQSLSAALRDAEESKLVKAKTAYDDSQVAHDNLKGVYTKSALDEAAAEYMRGVAAVAIIQEKARKMKHIADEMSQLVSYATTCESDAESKHRAH